jgi:hypothetical protein
MVRIARIRQVDSMEQALKEVLDFLDVIAEEKIDKPRERPDLKQLWYKAFPCFNDT